MGSSVHFNPMEVDISAVQYTSMGRPSRIHVRDLCSTCNSHA